MSCPSAQLPGMRIPDQLTVGDGAPIPDELLERIQGLRDEAIEARNELFSLYQDLPGHDPRILVAGHLKSVVTSNYLSMIYVRENLVEPAWWNRHDLGAHARFGNVRAELDEYIVVLKSTLMIHSFALFETAVRRIVRALNPNRASFANAEFKKICDLLLTRLRQDGWTSLNGQPAEFIALFDFVRNTLVNDGTYCSETETNASLVWRGTGYEFVHGAVPAFVNWNFNLELLQELTRLNKSIMQAPLLRRLSPIP